MVIKDKDLSDLSATITAALTPKIGAAKATLFGMIYGQARQATAKDLLVLTSSAVIGKVDEKRVDELKKLGIKSMITTKKGTNSRKLNPYKIKRYETNSAIKFRVLFLINKSFFLGKIYEVLS